MGERLHLIGAADDPVYVCKKKDVPKLFTQEFYQLFEAWQYFHHGLGFPSPEHWTKLDPDYTKTIISMENHYERYFSTNSVLIKYLEASLKRG